MPIATRQEGPRAPLFYCALLIAPVQFALAQSVDTSELERCASLESAAAKLACYEALTPVAEPSAPPEPPETLIESTVVEAEPESADRPPAAASSEPPPEPPAVPSTMDPPAADAQRPSDMANTSAPVEVADATQGGTSAKPAAAARDPMEGLGRDEPEPEAITGRVTKVTKDVYGRLIFHFDNGQQWRQFEKRYYPYPRDREFDVTISTGMMGDRRLQVEGAGRKVLIKRLR